MSFLFQWYEEIAMKVQTHNDTSAMAAGRLDGAGEIPMRITKIRLWYSLKSGQE